MGKQTVKSNPNETIEEIEGKKVKFTKPNVGQSSEADMEYSKGYANAMKAGLPPKIVVARQIEENNLWPVENVKRADELSVLIEGLVVKVGTLTDEDKDKEERGKIRQEFSDMNAELINLDIEYRQLFSHTAETKGEEARMTCLAWQCILNEDGSKIWNSREEFLSSPNDSFLSQAIRRFILFFSNMESTLEEIDTLFGDKEEAPVEAVSEETPKESAPDEEAKEAVVAE